MFRFSCSLRSVAVLGAAFIASGLAASEKAQEVIRADAPAKRQSAAELDRFGGCRAIEGEATGFFRVEKIDRRWWLVTGARRRRVDEARLDLENPDDLARLKRVVRRYFQVTTEAIRRYDRDHLIFGPRFGRPEEVPDWLLELAGEPYEECVSRMQEFNRNRLYSTALGQ